MISVVSVFNHQEKLEHCLAKSLSSQTVPYEFIPVDNRNGQFKNAASALNFGASKAKGQWILFVHQDVHLLWPDWLEKAEGILKQLNPKGWSGIVGRTLSGKYAGVLRDRDGVYVFDEPFGFPVEVQTLDELLLIHRSEGENFHYFDESLPSWHAYGIDACCTAIERGFSNYVLPLPVWHDSDSINRSGLEDCREYVWRKHSQHFKQIYTTVGVLPSPYGWSKSYKVSRLFRKMHEWKYSDWRPFINGIKSFEESPWKILDQLTANEAVVDCFHEPAWYKKIEGVGFTDKTIARRKVIHHFEDLVASQVESQCIVISPDLTEGTPYLRNLPFRMRRLIVCLYLDDQFARPEYWVKNLGNSFQAALARDEDGTYWAILDVKR